MTSKERKEARYQRRKAERERRKRERCEALGGLQGVFTYSAMFKYGRKCCNGVRWKRSVQNFELHLFSGTAKRRREILEGRWKPDKYVKFTVTERGKARPIDAPRVQDRQVHKTFTRGCLLPLYLPGLIYNNGASLPGKGFHFSLHLMCDELRRHFKRYGREGWIILTDYKKYFPSAPHAALYARHERLILDEDLRKIADQIVATIPGDRGLPLGVEPSQTEMIALPSPVDNHVKCQMRQKNAGHYMDDYHIIVPPDQDPRAVLAELIERSAAMGLVINEAKTVISPLTKPFKYCKAKFTLTETGRVIVTGNRDSMKRSRKKFKKLHELYVSGELTLDEVVHTCEGMINYFKNYDNHGRILKLRRLFYALFGFSIEKYKQHKEAEPCVLSYIGDSEPSDWTET